MFYFLPLNIKGHILSYNVANNEDASSFVLA